MSSSHSRTSRSAIIQDHVPHALAVAAIVGVIMISVFAVDNNLYRATRVDTKYRIDVDNGLRMGINQLPADNQPAGTVSTAGPLCMHEGGCFGKDTQYYADADDVLAWVYNGTVLMRYFTTKDTWWVGDVAPALLSLPQQVMLTGQTISTEQEADLDTGNWIPLHTVMGFHDGTQGLVYSYRCAHRENSTVIGTCTHYPINPTAMIVATADQLFLNAQGMTAAQILAGSASLVVSGGSLTIQTIDVAANSVPTYCVPPLPLTNGVDNYHVWFGKQCDLSRFVHDEEFALVSGECRKSIIASDTVGSAFFTITNDQKVAFFSTEALCATGTNIADFTHTYAVGTCGNVVTDFAVNIRLVDTSA